MQQQFVHRAQLMNHMASLHVEKPKIGKVLGQLFWGTVGKQSGAELLTTGTGEDPSRKLSSVLPEGLLKEAYSEQRCGGRLTAKELGSKERKNIRGSILSCSS